jgi:hypothetical protein
MPAHLSPTVQRSFLRLSVQLGHEERRCLIISSLYPQLRLASSATPTQEEYRLNELYPALA